MHPGTQESPEHREQVKSTALGNVVGQLHSLGCDYLPAASAHSSKWCLPLQSLRTQVGLTGCKIYPGWY